MINYSIIPPEERLEEEEPEDTREIEVDGVKLEVKLTSDQTGEIIRVISTNPQDYLTYQPGSEIEFGPQVN